MTRTTIAGLPVAFHRSYDKNCTNCEFVTYKLFRKGLRCGIILGLELEDGTYGYCDCHKQIYPGIREEKKEMKKKGFKIMVLALIFNLIESAYFGLGTDLGFNWKPQSLAEVGADYFSFALMIYGAYCMAEELIKQVKSKAGVQDGTDGRES